MLQDEIAIYRAWRGGDRGQIRSRTFCPDFWDLAKLLPGGLIDDANHINHHIPIFSFTSDWSLGGVIRITFIIKFDACFLN